MSVRYSIFYCTIYSSKKLPNLFKWRQKLTIVIMPSSNSHSAYPKRLANTQNLHKFFFLSLEGNSFTIAFASSDCQYDNLSARGSLDLESEAEQGWGDAGIDLRSKKCRKFYHHFLFLLLLLLHCEFPWYDPNVHLGIGIRMGFSIPTGSLYPYKVATVTVLVRIRIQCELTLSLSSLDIFHDLYCAYTP